MCALLVNDTTPRRQYVATAGQTVFAYPFEIFVDADLKVYQTLSGIDADDANDILTLTSEYTVSDAGVTGGGNVTLVTGAADGDIITIERDLAMERLTDYQNLGDFESTSFNDDLDRVVMMAQQNEANLTRTFNVNRANSSITDFKLIPDGGKALTWKTDESGIESVPIAIGTMSEGATVASKTAAAALTLSSADDGKKVFITSADGGTFTVRYNATPGTYADNGGAYCGTVFIPTGGDGTIGLERDYYGSVNISAFGGSPSASAATNVAAFRNYLSSVATSGAYECVCESGVYNFNDRVVEAATMTRGVSFLGVRPSGNDSADGTAFKSSYAGILFDIKEPNGTDQSGNWKWKNITFECTNVAGGALGFNDSSITMTDDNTSPNYILRVEIENCAFWGEGSTLVTGHAIQAAGLFNSHIDLSCFFTGWARGVFLNGCDNNTIDGRYSLNGRHIHLTKAGTFGNDNTINSRWLGTNLGSTAEDNYPLWDSSDHLVVNSTEMQASTSASVAGMYLNGRGTRLMGLDFNFNTQKLWRLGPDARDIVMLAPMTLGTPSAPQVDAATSYVYGSPYGYRGMSVLNPSEMILRLMAGVIRHLVSENVPLTNHPSTRIGTEVVTANGIAQKKFVFNASNYYGLSSGIGFTAATGPSADPSEVYLGTAVKVQATNNAGYANRINIDEGLSEGDTIKITYWYRMSSALTGTNYRYIIMKNGVNVTNSALTPSTSYVSQTVTYTLSGFSNGDTIEVGVYNNAVTAGDLLVSNIIIEVCDPANADTSGATLVQLETEVNELKATMRTFGLIGG